ncbi:MAG: cytochrome c biogenesis protein CcdA [Alphaproteobacteria bacterium]|nr:cytochrome c biogenesis protein CcdA [Alphaproteobacteria bacterium]
MGSEISYTAAAFAGLLSFLSPCVLPLVPPYLTYIAGTTVEELAAGGARRARRDVALAALLFVLGFSTVFVTLGATASMFGMFVRQYLPFLSMAAGAVIIAMGLHFLGVWRLAFLYREARVSVEKPVGLWGAYVMGLAFAFGWTPCIGPILAAILALAGTEDTAGKGAAMLAVYSAGLGVPFLLAAFAIEPFMGFLQRFKTKFVVIEKTVGVLLVLTGIAFLTGWLTNFAFWLLEMFPALGKLG